MATEAEELQAKEFLKRAEIRTMKKDLSILREADSLQERDKIAHIKTLEEQQAEHQKQLEALEAAKAGEVKIKREEVLQRNENQEYAAEKNLKNYATEQERQQIFLFESQRMGLENQMKEIDEKKDPVLKMEKQKVLLSVRDWQQKLSSIIANETKLEDEQKLIAKKEQETAVSEERKSLSQRRWDLDKEIQEIEKKRWEVEKNIQDLDNKIKSVDQSSQLLVVEKNGLRDKILGIDKSLREIYSGVIARVEEKRRGQAAEQKQMQEAVARAEADKNERVQRQQWTGKEATPDAGFMKNIPVPLKKKLDQTASSEEEQRKKFLQDVSLGTNKGQSQQQKSNIK